MFKGRGNPYGASNTMGAVDDEVKDIIGYQTRRLVEVASKLAA